MADPIYNNQHVPPVEGLVFVGAHKGRHDTYDVYVIVREDGWHAVTVVWGEDDWQWESDTTHRISRREGIHASGEGPYHYGFTTAQERGLLGGPTPAASA